MPAPLTGVVPPVCTPLTPDREVDVPSLLRLVDHLVDAGVHGLFVLGTSSEAAFLTDRQRGLVVETVVARAAGRLSAGRRDATEIHQKGPKTVCAPPPAADVSRRPRRS
jgi:dihydrodipicolinate synthase/N-acetylneuraminate lyase